jgi:Tannase and feruloyl esterase
MSFRAIAVSAALLATGACSSDLTSTANAPVADASAAERCAAITSSRLGDVVIASASLQAANAPIPGASIAPGMPPISGLPEFCRVVGSIHPEAGANIGFEVWLPSGNWDGRLHGFGIGGFAGAIGYMDLASAIRAGTVGVASDTGHRGTMEQSEWAKGRPDLVRDYGWRAIHLATVAAKDILEHFYGRAADHSYFMGCSGGGRQGLIEASRFPEDYDGIVSGAPAAVFSNLAMSWAWSVQAQMPEGAALRAEQMPLLQSEVLAQCDALDGQAASSPIPALAGSTHQSSPAAFPVRRNAFRRRNSRRCARSMPDRATHPAGSSRAAFCPRAPRLGRRYPRDGRPSSSAAASRDRPAMASSVAAFCGISSPRRSRTRPILIMISIQRVCARRSAMIWTSNRICGVSSIAAAS